MNDDQELARLLRKEASGGRGVFLDDAECTRLIHAISALLDEAAAAIERLSQPAGDVREMLQAHDQWHRDYDDTGTYEGSELQARTQAALASRHAPTENNEQIIEGCNRYANRRAYKSAPTPEAVPVADAAFEEFKNAVWQTDEGDLLLDLTQQQLRRLYDCAIQSAPPTTQARDAVIEEMAAWLRTLPADTTVDIAAAAMRAFKGRGE